MHTWVRRGLRTALVTGGLLMLGTGIASADENVSPDLPPSPVDAGVSTPVVAGHVPLDGTVYRIVGGAVDRKATTPSLTAAGARAPKIASRTNPLVRQAQPVARQVEGRPAVDRGDTLSGVLTTAQMAGPTRSVNDAVTAARAEPAGWTRGLPHANSTGSDRSNGTPSGRASAITENDSVVHNGFIAQPDNPALPGGVRGTDAHSPVPRQVSSVPQNAVLPGTPVVPSIKGVGLFYTPESQSAPASVDALPSAPTVASVRDTIGRESSQLPVTYGVGSPTPAVPTRQTPQMLDHSPLDSLPGGLSVGRVVSGVTSRTQDGVHSTAVQARDARSTDLPPEAVPPPEPTVGQVAGSAPSVPVTDVAGPPSALVQSLEASSVPAVPDVSSLPAEPTVAPEAMLDNAGDTLSHVEVRPADANTAAVRPATALDRSTLGASPSAPKVPSVPDVSSAPAARNVADTVPVTQAAVVPFAAAATTALPAPAEAVLQPLDKTTLGTLPSVPVVGDAVASLFSQLPVKRVAEAPSSVRQRVDGSPLRGARTGQVPFSLPDRPSARQATDALPTASSLSGAWGTVDKAASRVPELESAVLPVSALATSPLVSSTDQGVRSDAGSAVDVLPGVSPMAAATSVAQMTGVPNSVRNGVNGSPLGVLPGAPNVPPVPPRGDVVGSAADVAWAPTHVTKMTEVPVSDVNTANLPSAPVGSLGSSPAGRMFRVQAVRQAAASSLATVPVEQAAEVPDTVSRRVNESRFASLPGEPRLHSVPSAPELAERTASEPPGSYAVGAGASTVHATHVFGRPAAALPGVSEGDSIAGILPVVQNVFPRI
jgi:hypothetical protein